MLALSGGAWYNWIMTRTEQLERIQAALPTLSDDRIAAVREMIDYWAGPAIFDGLSDAHKARIDQALDRLDAGQGIPAEQVFASIADRLKARSS